MSDIVQAQGYSFPFGKLGENNASPLNILQSRALAVQPVLPELSELARAGVLYGANNGSAVGLPNVAGIPTTAATYGLYNNHASKYAVVLKIAVIATTVAPPKDFALIAGLPLVKQASAETKYASSLALAINPNSPEAGAYLTDAVTLAGTPLWQTLGVANLCGELLGAGIVAWTKGMFYVPPGYCLGIDIVGSAGTTPLFDVDILWAELDVTTR
jgi:hypothetical protein